MAALLLLYFGSRATDRRQCVNLTGTVSNTEVLSSGIPQGSILGPALFLLFIKGELKAKNKYFFYLRFRPHTILFSTFFWHIPCFST